MTARSLSMIGLALGIAITAPLATPALAQPSKEQCIDAHGRGQDAKEQGKLTLARKLFLTCAQPSCPALVQGDCARFADDLMRQQSSLTFLARDAQGADLPDTAVYVDDVLLLTRLDDGKPHEVDPGRHTVRFSSAGKDQTVTLVVGAGEQGRAVVATFSSINPPAGVTAGGDVAGRPPQPRVFHPPLAKALIIGGAAATAAGIGFYIWGSTSMPKNCHTSPNRCTAPPGDPVFDDASSAMKKSNIGLITGSIGVAALAGGLVWYFTKAETIDGTARPSGLAAGRGRAPAVEPTRVTPILLTSGAGIALSGQF